MTSVSTDRRFGVNADAAVKVPCKAATTANVTLSGEQTVDGVALVTDDRVLVKNQTTSADNGIYVVDTGDWSRALDWDGIYDAKNGSLVYVTEGSTYADNLFVCTTSDPITIGTTSVAFAIVSTGNPLTLPLPLAQGGTASTSKSTAAAALGVVVLTGAGGTANVQTATGPSTYTAFATNDVFVLTPSVTNTGATTMTITPSGGSALTTKNVFCAGRACTGGELKISTPVLVQYDGTQINILGAIDINALTADASPDQDVDYVMTYDASATSFKKVLVKNLKQMGPLTNSLSGNVSLSNTGSYFGGPTVAQGSTGTWFFSGTVTVTDTAGAATINVKLTDGTTVIATAASRVAGANVPVSISISGYLATPAGSVAIQVNDATSTSGSILANSTGSNKDSTLTAVRIG